MSLPAREVVTRILQASLDQDIDGFVALLAPDAHLEWPYRPPGAPAGLRGRTEIRAHLAQVAGTFVRFDRHRDVVMHETLDPEVIIVEYEADGTLIPTGAPFRQTVISVWRVRDGQVVFCRDYINPLPLIEAHAGR
ncbi:nuclear transport factor 2 family protein [Nucisporomicrobium flavum]|jgi:uncharacterized protein|uniref:nuclear transport factor 2 family protein n=1 Tax=Nucisporomicrobium flavum TaxID=2785915 RepID=UPI0018F5A225|nr:nuclear transport factor 2 family protein [Nucisporomicrobium flavum]